ncbi:hypothetical protein M9Y10_002427 [Tritrichomonas musculus]|uniref:Uncharacterized protein n=1 Tax=Tritrichomonas musculus TaxID=1915356 RepID=A0ABR2L9T8_9EUKA
MNEESTKVLDEIKAVQGKADSIVDLANQRKQEFLSSTLAEAKSHIASVKADNDKNLRALKKDLDRENDAKKKEVEKQTTKQIEKLQANGEKHLEQLIELLYNTVINVDTE